MNELYERVNYYSSFHQGGIQKLLKDAKKFIKKRKYSLDVVDVCIAATANALKVNLYIFEKINNKVQIIKHKCSCVDTDKTIYLCYTHTPNTNHLGDHYDAVVNIQVENTQENDVDSDATEMFTCEETQKERTEENQENMTSTSTSSHTEKKRKHKKNKLNMHSFENVPIQKVDAIPWEIDGNCIYQLKCNEDEFIDKQRDGRWWKMSESGRVDLNGRRKTGTCQGSFICNNKNCTKVTTESVINTIDFKQERGGGYSCNSCGYYAIRQACGRKRAVELDKDTGLMTLWHEGTHTCKAKPNKALKTQ